MNLLTGWFCVFVFVVYESVNSGVCVCARVHVCVCVCVVCESVNRCCLLCF